jgi:hypothetical protein
MSAIGQPSNTPAPSGQPATPPPSTGQAAPTPQEQGQQTQQRESGFWGRFPTVPEDQRAALEPHLKQVQGYVTRLEQTYVAPFKGYTPQQVQGLAQFAKAFDTNPLQTFLGIAAQLQQAGTIHEDLDLEALAAVVQGQDPPDLDDPNIPVDDGQGDPWESAPAWALELRAQQQAQEQQQQQTARTQAEARENAVLDHSVKSIRTKLTEAGFPEGAVSDKDIIARFIVHNGKAEAVLNDLSQLRTTLLQGAIPNPPDDTVDLPHGVPRTGRSSLQQRAKGSKDPFAKASAAAEQFVATSNRRNAQ